MFALAYSHVQMFHKTLLLHHLTLLCFVIKVSRINYDVCKTMRFSPQSLVVWELPVLSLFGIDMSKTFVIWSYEQTSLVVNLHEKL